MQSIKYKMQNAKWPGTSPFSFFIFHFSFFISLSAFWSTSATPARAEGYAWPMAVAPALTSSFGEYRPGRLHAGIDLKTWGKEGYPAVAVDDGYVWRVRTSPWGYGRAVYLRLRNGQTAVYAHLSAFSPRIAEVVQAEQDRRVAYSVDLYLARDRIPVKRGETLGRSGSSGVGVPHLHFELRDGNQRPLNPLTHGFGVTDGVAPTVRSVALVPLDSDARVAGGHRPYPVGVRWQRKGQRYISKGRVEIAGRVGVAIDVYDRADASRLTNRLAPYRLRLLVDGQEVFQTTYTVFSYDRVHQVELDRNFALSKRGAGRFHNLYRDVGNGLPLYGAYREGDGVLHAGVVPAKQGVRLAPGVHRIEVVAEDAAGNTAVAEVTVLAGARPRVLGVHAEAAGDSVRVQARVTDGDGDSLRVFFEASRDGGKTWARLGTQRVAAGETVARTVQARALYRVRARDPYDLEGVQTCALRPDLAGAGDGPALACSTAVYPRFAVIGIAADRALDAPPRVTARPPGGGETALVVVQRGLRSYEAVWPFRANVEGAVRVTVDGGGTAAGRTLTLVQQPVRVSGGAVRSDDGAAEARFGAGCAYRPFFGRAEAAPAGEAEGLPSVGMAYRFTPDDVPFNGRAALRLRYPTGTDRPERLGVYEQTDDGEWAFLGNAVDADSGIVTAEVRHFSTYALRLDETPPVLANLRPASGAVTGDRRPVLAVGLKDAGSGIGREGDISMRLNGQAVIFEYDPEKEQATARPRRSLTPGTHRLEVTVRDMCGNEVRQVSEFTVR